ncbi:polysaccharide pyruvyl transferase family protein [Butyrivibrio sp. INlla16]|uniref:polysaccharide pyruvyl transferase family protein n=1 Tax=Butyrivibrio sp. INlla16 TaxID=1520807 RepID=UPI00088B0FC4|nr:polysaccharide pyruvyl transferase family protein [Butyrivibrio sp. INlla16]SDB47634.1 Polysaccharide pyruvyl transferase family protein WcaK [Butyrivibrio sp. INlla16]
MKKILVRGGMSPFDKYDVSDIILNNRFGTNAGNMVYLYGVYRSIMTGEDVEIDVDRYIIERGHSTEEDIKRINEEYSMYIIPLADAFRDSFINCLNALTRAIRKMTIPVVIVGVGMKIGISDSINDEHPCDQAVKDFVSAVLDHSSMVGVRGEITGSYLKRLGFKEGTQFTPIGCPSLYLHGANLKLKRLTKEINKDSGIIVNASMLSTENINRFLRRILTEYPNATFIPQLVRELREMYLGAIYRKEDTAYPIRTTDEVFTSDKARFFVNVPSWFDYVKDRDLSVGARMHGNIASINCGIPSVLLVKDGRMKELIDYHKLPHATPDVIDDNTTLEEIVGRTNLYSIEDVHEANFRHYVDFLEQNNIDSVFKGYNSPEKTIFDEKISQITWDEPITPILTCDEAERIRRIEEYLDYEEGYIEELKERIRTQNRVLNRYKKYLPGFVTKKFEKLN